MRHFLRCAPALLLLAGTRVSGAQMVPHDTSPHQVRVVTIAPKVRLEVLDWGGRGPPLIFLAGLGNTAHVFDGFAPMFTDSFHVLGITRRGFGLSATLPPPNSVDTLALDIRLVLDSLALATVVVVGHSIAGEEMTRFAEVNPGRCAALVYMDAAYDRTGIPAILKASPPPPWPPMRAADSASFPALRSYWARTGAVELPDSDLLATSRLDSSGRYMGEATPDSLIGRVMAGVRTPHYDRVQCRSLAIYGVPDSAVDVIPYYAELDSLGRAQANEVFKALRPYSAASRQRFRQLDRNRVVEMPRAHHYMFLTKPHEVARAIRAFLAERE